MLKLPDPKPLAAALATIDNLEITMTRLAAEQVKLQGIVDQFIADFAPADDQGRVTYVSGCKMRLEALPRLEEKTVRDIEAAGETLKVEMERFERALAHEANNEGLALTDKLETMLRPFAPSYIDPLTKEVVNRARNTASGLPIITNLPTQHAALPVPIVHDDGNQLTRDYRLDSFKKRAAGLLEYFATVQKDGSFVNEGFAEYRKALRS